MTQISVTLPQFAIRHGRIGGVESAIYNLAHGLHAYGADLTVAHSRTEFLSPEFLAWEQSSRVRVKRYPTLGQRLSARFAEEAWFGLHKISGHVIYPNYFLPPIRRQTGKAGVIIHDFQYRAFPQYFTDLKRRWLDRCYAHALRSADHVFFISAFEQAQASRFFGDVFTANSSVIYNAIDINRYHRTPASAAIIALCDRPFILSVAHQHRHKNVETLIRAFAEASQQLSDMRLILVGTASPAVRSVVDQLPGEIRERITLTGFVSDSDLGHLYNRMSLFALPSRYEGFGMPAIEALVHDRPVLLADAGALREVTLGLASYVPDNASPSLWAGALIAAVDAPGIGADKVAMLVERYHPTTIARNAIAALLQPAG